jgi:DNA-binding CsgD family transcriptional regulator
MSSRRAISALKAACELDLPAPSLVPVLLEALHDVVPSARNLFDWTDERGRLLHYFIEGPVDDAVARLYFDEFHNRREREVMPAFDSLLQAPAGVRSAAELDHPRFFESALYREIWLPQGLKYRLEAVLRGSRGQLLGSLVLYRGPGDRCFTRADEQQLAALLPLLGGALERSDTPVGPVRHVPRPQATQSLLIGPDRRIGHASPDARRLLMLANGGITRERLELPLDRLAAPVLDLLLPPVGAAPPSVTQENAWGCFTFMATPLAPQSADAGATGAPLVQVSIHWSEPHHQALQRALRQLPLTPGQLAVCRDLYLGHSQSWISERLGVAPTTVTDHVRKLYRTLEVRSALELRARVDAAVQTPRAG